PGPIRACIASLKKEQSYVTGQEWMAVESWKVDEWIFQAEETAWRHRAEDRRPSCSVSPGACGLAVPTGDVLGWVFAVDPLAGQFLIFRWDNDAAGVTALPVGDLVGLAMVLGALLPPLGPACVSRHRLALLCVPEQSVAAAIALHTHVHRGERGGAQFRRAQRLAIVAADAFQVVSPECFRVVLVVLEAGHDDLALHVLEALGNARAALHVLRQDFQPELADRFSFLVLFAGVFGNE